MLLSGMQALPAENSSDSDWMMMDDNIFAGLASKEVSLVLRFMSCTNPLACIRPLIPSQYGIVLLTTTPWHCVQQQASCKEWVGTHDVFPTFSTHVLDLTP